MIKKLIDNLNIVVLKAFFDPIFGVEPVGQGYIKLLNSVLL